MKKVNKPNILVRNQCYEKEPTNQTFLSVISAMKKNRTNQTFLVSIQCYEKEPNKPNILVRNQCNEKSEQTKHFSP